MLPLRQLILRLYNDFRRREFVIELKPESWRKSSNNPDAVTKLKTVAEEFKKDIEKVKHPLKSDYKTFLFSPLGLLPP